MTDIFFDQSPSAFFAYDKDHNIVALNSTMESLIGRPKELLLKKKVEIILTIASRIFFQTHLFPLIQMQGFAEEIFVSLSTADNRQIPVLLNARKIETEGKTVVACSCISVPNRKKFEDELVLAKKEAQRIAIENTELIEAKSRLSKQTQLLDHQFQIVSLQNQELKEFSHVITHNLKEPLRKILIYTERLLIESKAPSLQKLQHANEQMKEVVFGLQQYIWINEKKNFFTNVDMNEIVQSVISTFTDNYSELTFEVSVSNLPNIEGDVDQLRLLVEQIISNAVKFRKENIVQLTIEGVLLKKNTFKHLVNHFQYADYLRISFNDQGIGFDNLYSGIIFGLFRKLHHIEGLGLGLSLCKKIVDNHNGYIEAVSEIGKFTTVSVFLPPIQKVIETDMVEKNMDKLMNP